MTKKVLITGATGMLGTIVADTLENKYDVFTTGNSNIGKKCFPKYKPFDLRGNSYAPLISWAEPDAIIHCAAITDVDYCEKHPSETLAVNGESVRKLLQDIGKRRIIYISSDTVFPAGTHLAKETDEVKPVNMYGKSKALGERYLLEDKGPHIVVRTTIIGKHENSPRQSFAEWIISSVRKHKSITLFTDVCFTPVSIWYLAKEVYWFLERDMPKIIHLASSDIISKYDFGRELCTRMKLDISCILKGKFANSALIAMRKIDQSLDSAFYSGIRDKASPSTRDAITDFLVHR